MTSLSLFDDTEDHNCWRKLHDWSYSWVFWELIFWFWQKKFLLDAACLAPVVVSTCWSVSWCAWVAFPALPSTEIVSSSFCMKSSKSSHTSPAFSIEMACIDFQGPLLMIFWTSAMIMGFPFFCHFVVGFSICQLLSDVFYHLSAHSEEIWNLLVCPSNMDSKENFMPLPQIGGGGGFKIVHSQLFCKKMYAKMVVFKQKKTNNESKQIKGVSLRRIKVSRK